MLGQQSQEGAGGSSTKLSDCLKTFSAYGRGCLIQCPKTSPHGSSVGTPTRKHRGSPVLPDPDTQELWWEAYAWWYNRQLQLNHLTLAPDLYFWRTGSEVNLHWDVTGRDAAGPRWAVQHARVTVPFEEAHKAVETFCQSLLSAMAERVATIERDGWGRSDCGLDATKLVAEQHERETWPSTTLPRTFETHWNAVRRTQDKLKMG